MSHRLTRLAGLTSLMLALAVARPIAAGNSKVADAAERRAIVAVKALVRQGVDVNVPQRDGATALHWAAHWNDLGIASELLRAGANPNAANEYGVTPLVLAAENGSADMVAALLQAGADPNKALPTGQTALMTAARSGDIATVKALFTRGANVEAAQGSQQQTALMWAIAQRHTDVVQLLIEHGADLKARTRSGFTPLLFAAREGDMETVRTLIEKGVDVNASSNDGATALLIATARGHVNLALFLLEQGAHPDGNFKVAGYTPLHWAVTTFETSPVTYPAVEVPGEWAAMSGIPERQAKITLIKRLIATGADVNARTTKALLHQAPLISARTTSPAVSFTPFLAAAGSADAEVMRLLVALGADPLLRTRNNETAVMVASAGDVDVSVILAPAKRLEVVSVAWELGVDLEAADTSREHRAMHLAARAGYHDIIRFLVEHGADLNSKTKPIRERGYEKAIQNIAAQTPLGLSEGTVYGPNFHQRPDTAEFLRTLGAKSEGRHYPAADQDKARGAAELPR